MLPVKQHSTWPFPWDPPSDRLLPCGARFVLRSCPGHLDQSGRPARSFSNRIGRWAGRRHGGIDHCTKPMASPCERYCACGGLVAPDWSTGKQRGKVLVVGPERGLSWTGRGALERVRRRADLGLHAAVSIVARGQIKSTEIGDVRVKVAGLGLRLRGSSYGGATPNALARGAAFVRPLEKPNPFCTYGGGAWICGFATPDPAPTTEHRGRSPAKHGRSHRIIILSVFNNLPRIQKNYVL
jgi:hypothetical protein